MAFTKIDPGTAGMNTFTQTTNLAVDQGVSPASDAASTLLEAFGQVAPAIGRYVQTQDGITKQNAYEAGQAAGVKRIASGDKSLPTAPGAEADTAEKYQYAGTMEIWSSAKRQEVMVDLENRASEILADTNKVASGQASKEIAQMYDTELKGIADAVPELAAGLINPMYRSRSDLLEKAKTQQIRLAKAKAEKDARIGLVGMLDDGPGAVAKAYNTYKNSVISDKAIEVLLDQAKLDAQEGNFKTLEEFESLMDDSIGMKSGDQLATLYGQSAKLESAREVRSKYMKDLAERSLKEEEAQFAAAENEVKQLLQQDKITGAAQEPGYGIARAKEILESDQLSSKSKTELLGMLPAHAKEATAQAISAKVVQDPVQFNNAIATNQLSGEEATKGLDAYMEALLNTAATIQDPTTKANVVAIEVDRLAKINAKATVIDTAIKAFTTGQLFDENGKRIGSEASTMIMSNLLNTADFASMRNTYGFSMKDLQVLQATQRAIKNGATFENAMAGAARIGRDPASGEALSAFEKSWAKDGMEVLMKNSSWIPGQNDSLFGVSGTNIAGNLISAGSAITMSKFWESFDEKQARNSTAGIILKNASSRYAAMSVFTNPNISPEEVADNFKKEIAAHKYIAEDAFVLLPDKDLVSKKALYMPAYVANNPSARTAMTKAMYDVVSAKAKKTGWKTEGMAIDASDPDVVTVYFKGTEPMRLDRKQFLDYAAGVVEKNSVDADILDPATQGVLGSLKAIVRDGPTSTAIAKAKAGLSTAKGTQRKIYEGVLYQAMTDAEKAKLDVEAYTKAALSTAGAKSNVQVNKESLDIVLGLRAQYATNQEAAQAAASPITGPLVTSKTVSGAAREVARTNLPLAAIMVHEGFVQGGKAYQDGTKTGPKYPTYGFGFNTGYNNRKDPDFRKILAAAGLPTSEQFMDSMEKGKAVIDFDASMRLLQASVDIKYAPQVRKAYGEADFDNLPVNLKSVAILAGYNAGPNSPLASKVYKAIRAGNVHEVANIAGFASHTKGVMLKAAKGTSFFTNSIVAGRGEQKIAEPVATAKEPKPTAKDMLTLNTQKAKALK